MSAQSNLLSQKPALAKASPVWLASLYADMDMSLGQRKFVKAICEQASKQIVAKVLRGGGKTKCAAVAFAWLLLNDPKLHIFVQSGSFIQARRLYQYFRPLVTNPELFPKELLITEPTQSLTLFKDGGSLEVLTASQRSSRGGHVDIVCLDEAVLIKPELIDAIWPTVRTSKCPKRIVISTASAEVNLEWFLRLWQDAPRLGFERHEWPLTECTWINKEDSASAALMLDSQTYRIEYLGEIGERKGRVWDTALIDRCLVDPRAAEQYPIPRTPPLTEWSVGHDWGFVHPTVTVPVEKQSEVVYVRDCRIRSETSLSDIMQELREDFAKYPIYPDSAGTHENDQLQRLGLKVNPVIFSKDKDALIGHVRWRLEKGLLKIPNPEVDSRYFTLVQQMKGYTYDDHGKPRKVNDDCVDALLCAMKPFIQPELFHGHEMVG